MSHFEGYGKKICQTTFSSVLVLTELSDPWLKLLKEDTHFQHFRSTLVCSRIELILLLGLQL